MRILGPYRGHYVAVTALVAGTVADQYIGLGHIFDRQPADFYDGTPIATIECPQLEVTVEAALQQAENLAFEKLGSLPEKACGPDEAATGPLWAIAYVSTAHKLLSAWESKHLLESARARNRSLGVTGMLLYLDDTFMQYIEGPRPQLEMVYRIIRRDPTHHGLAKLLKTRIAQRVFPDWSMGFDSPIAAMWGACQSTHVSAPEQGSYADTIKSMLALFVQRNSVRDELLHPQVGWRPGPAAPVTGSA